MTINASELTINALYHGNPDLFTIAQKDFKIFYRDVMAFNELSTSASRKITKNTETHPPPMRDVIIKQPQTISSCN